MRKLIASIKKEFQLLIHDKVGLLLMYAMPIVLVFIITLVQDSAFKIVNDNQLEILVTNQDKGALGDSLVNILKKSGSFIVEEHNQLSEHSMQQKGIKDGKLASVFIPSNFSEAIQNNTGSVTKLILKEFGMNDDSLMIANKNTQLTIYFDPILQQNYQYTLVTNIQTILFGMENQVLIHNLFSEMGYDEIPDYIAEKLTGEQTPVVAKQASLGKKQTVVPNSTQHNVPAWSIFAMFFMVVSLGGNIVKERNSGSFVRLMTIPPSFTFTLISKMLIYLGVAMSQLLLLFSIGYSIFPLIGLPALQIPASLAQLVVVALLSGMAAVSYAVLIGTYAKTQEQANGFGAISIVIFAAIGGIWVPTFVMPDYMQTIALFSPLYWCLDGFYTLFLKNGDWNELSSSTIFLSFFVIVCQILTFVKLKFQNYL
ncbi:MAG: ABC transporter permease [Crocinitomicaceae bacterium]|nr:ABC transporter permease [Crocinitomicaceae bacterium]